MLVLDKINSGYGRAQILRDLSLTVRSGEILCLLGRNGAGKTTTMQTIMGLLPLMSGRIALDGQDIRVATRASRAASRYRLCAAGAQVVHGVERGAEPRDWAACAAQWARHARGGADAFPPIARTLPAAGRNAVRGRTADVGHRPRPMPATQGVAAGRADRRACSPR